MQVTLTREEALKLLKTYNQEPFHIQHALTVEGVMRWYANDLGYGEDADYWAMVGLLHDVDFENWPEEHCLKAPELLRAAMGKCGVMIWQYANGLERSPVAVYGTHVPVKSVGNSTTTPRDLTTDDDVRITLYLLSESVAERLQEQGMRAQVVSVSVRSNDLQTVGFQMRLNRKSNLSADIAKCAYLLFRRNYRWSKPIRSLGVCASDLSLVEEPEQLAFFDDPARDRMESLESTIVGLRQKFGRNCVRRGLQLVDRALSAVDPKDDHTIHPEPWLRN